MTIAVGPRKSGAKAAWRNVMANASVLLGERAVFGLVNLAAVAVAVRAVGLEAFGAVVLVHAYARLLGDTLRFKSWQAVLRYGALPLAEGRREDMRRLIGLSLRLDVAAVVGSLVLAWIAAGWVAALLDWPEATARWAPWYAFAIVFMVQGTPTGVLRLLDRFGILAAQHAMSASIRLAGATAVWVGGGGGEALMAVWFAATAASGGWMIWTAFSLLAARGLTPRLGGGWRALQQGFDGYWHFVFATNLSATLSSGLTHLTTLVAGGVLGPAGAALYSVAKQIADALSKPAKLLSPIIFPEISHMLAQKRRKPIDGLLLRALAAGGAGACLIALVVGAAGETLLVAVFGPEALSAYDLVVLAAAAGALSVWGFALDPALLAAGRAGQSLAVELAATAAYAACLAIWLPAGGGLTAIGAALLMYAIVVFCGRLTAVWAARRAWN